jgi:hypothetical protein
MVSSSLFYKSIVCKIDAEIENAKNAGTIKTGESIYTEINGLANDLGLDVIFSVFRSSEDSSVGIMTDEIHYRAVSTLSIWVRTTQNLVENGAEGSNWDGEYNHTQCLVKKWNDLIIKYGYPNNYKDDKMKIFFTSFESFYLSTLIFSCKPLIKEMIQCRDVTPKPDYVFCSSEPAYNIVFKHSFDYYEFKQKQYEQNVTGIICAILKANAKYGYPIEERVKIHYLHGQMGISLNGLSREE